MAECGTDAQIHVSRYEGGPQAWPIGPARGRSVGAELASEKHSTFHTCTSFISRFSLIKQESQERGFKIHTVLKR